MVRFMIIKLMKNVITGAKLAKMIAIIGPQPIHNAYQTSGITPK
jgi:hypothetical protein